VIVLQNREQKLLVRLYTIQNQPLKWQLCLYAKNTYTRAYHMHINWLKKNVTEIFTKVLRQDIDNTIQNPNETWKELNEPTLSEDITNSSCQNTKKHTSRPSRQAVFTGIIRWCKSWCKSTDRRNLCWLDATVLPNRWYLWQLNIFSIRKPI